MVPNLLPFSASVTTGGGSTQNAAAIPQAQPGFAAMLGMGATPVTQGSTGASLSGSAVTLSIMPPSTTSLLGLTDGTLVQPVEAAPTETLHIADPALGTVAPTDIAPQPVTSPATPEAMSGPVAAPPLPTTLAASALPPTNMAAAVSPAPGEAIDPVPTPAVTTSTVTGRPREAADPAPVTADAPVSMVDEPSEPAAPIQPVPTVALTPNPATDGIVVPSVEGPQLTHEAAPEGDAEQLHMPADPTPVAPPQGGSATIIEPIRSPAIPAPIPAPQDGPGDAAAPATTSAEPAAAASAPKGGTVTFLDGREKELDPAPALPPAAIDSAIDQAVPTEAMPVPAPTDPAAAVIAATIEPSTPASREDGSAPQTSPGAVAVANLAMPGTVHANPTPPQSDRDTAPTPAAVTSQPVEPAASDIAIDPPVDDGAFDTLVAAESDAPTEGLRTSSDAAGDTMSRDGNRQPAQQPQPSAPAPAAASAGPIPAFDPLAAPAPDATRPTSDPAAEPRARAVAIGEDVGLAIVRHADTGSGDVLVIRLDPAELGKIEVRLRMDEARQLSAEVTADQPATLDLLRRDSDNLTRALNDAGFRADDQSLRFDSRGFGQNEQQDQQGRRVASRAYLPEDDATASSIPSPVQVRSSGRVDLVA